MQGECTKHGGLSFKNLLISVFHFLNLFLPFPVIFRLIISTLFLSFGAYTFSLALCPFARFCTSLSKSFQTCHFGLLAICFCR